MQPILDTTGDIIYPNIEGGISYPDRKTATTYTLFRQKHKIQGTKKVLEYYGYQISGPAKGSSHKTFRKTGRNPITIPQNEPIKKLYVQKVREIVESEERDEEKDNKNN